jgi:hypothetical protein
MQKKHGSIGVSTVRFNNMAVNGRTTYFVFE